MLKWLPILALVTVGLFYWFGFAFMADNNHAWTTSDTVQIITGVGTLAGIVAMLAIMVSTARRAIRRLAPIATARFASRFARPS
jgi:TRAP-type C4-dicarboxylate transport system permease small subunit